MIDGVNSLIYEPKLMIHADIDECNDELLSCRGSGYICNNSIGSFQCSCNAGYVKLDEQTCQG